MSGKKIGGAVSPQRVVQKYAALVGGPVNARQIIALGLREGTLRARAGKRWISTDASLTLAWKNEPNKKDFVKPKGMNKEHDIRYTDWNKSSDFINDILTWNFRRSHLHITISTHPSKRIMLKHVRFFEEDAVKLFRFATDSGKSNFYRANKINEWRSFWHEMLIIVAQGRLNLKDNFITTFTNADDIAATIRERFALQDAAVNEAQNADLEVIKGDTEKKLGFTLSDETLQKEINELRKTLGLKRKYSSKNNALGLDRIVRAGTAGSTK